MQCPYLTQFECEGLMADYVLFVHLSQIILKVFTYNHQGLSIDTVLNQPE
jgi:hypothetical protein